MHLSEKINSLRKTDNSKVIEAGLQMSETIKRRRGRSIRATLALITIVVFAGFALAGGISLAALGGQANNAATVVPSQPNIFYSSVSAGGENFSTLTNAGQIFSGFVYGSFAVASLMAGVFAFVDKREEDETDEEVHEAMIVNAVASGVQTHNLEKQIDVVISEIHSINHKYETLLK